MKKALETIILFVFIAVPAFAEVPDAIIEQTKSAVVAIYADQDLKFLRGSGFFIDSQGRVLTNKHVVSEHERLWIKLYDGRSFEAEKIFPGNNDLFILKPVINTELAEPFPYLKFADRGYSYYYFHDIAAIGNSLEGTWQVVKGQTKGLRVSFNNQGVGQYSPTVLGGFSGSPLINESGFVIGVTTYSFYKLAVVYSDILFSEALDLNEVATFIANFYKASNADAGLLISVPVSLPILECKWIYTHEGRWCKQ